MVPMLDPKFVRENVKKVKENVRNRGLDVKLVDTFLELDASRRHLLQDIEKWRQRRNELPKNDLEEGRRIKKILRELEPNLKKVEERSKKALYQIPNMAAADVPVGKNESENVVLRQWGTPRKFDFEPKDHLELGEALDIIDVQRAGKVSGPRFGYLKGDLVLLELALFRFALDTLLKEGFIPILPPVMIKKEVMRGMGYLEHGGQDDMYVLKKDGLILVGTAEQSIGPMHAGEVFDARDLPRRYLGFSACFRREAGSYGKDTRGILRLHQFNKVEMFSFVRPENGDEEHEFLLSLEEKLMQKLELPYQVVKMCTGDLGAPAARKYDLEAWMPGQNKYREVTSTSTTTDFQSRRLNIKYKDGGKTGYVHMLNGTAFSERPLIAILENYQNADGSITIPKVLQPRVGKDRIDNRP
jgi:seryl-tRNA synthetase